MSQQLVTADAVLLDLRPARLPTRMLAVSIDLAVLLGASWLYSAIVDRVGGSSARIEAVDILGYLVINIGYLVGMETLTRGRTVGKLALGLRAVRDDGGPLAFRQALLRGLGFWSVDFAIWTGFCGGLVCAAVHPASKRLGDLLAGTMVVRTRAPRPPLPIPPVPAELAGWAAQLQLGTVPDELVTAARHLVQRAPGLLRAPRDQLAGDLAFQISLRTTPPPPAGLPPLEFLAAVVAERRRREADRLLGSAGVPTAAQLPAGWR